MFPIKHDCEAEEVLHRDPVGSEWNAREILNSPIEAIEEQFPDSPYAQESFNALHLQHIRCPNTDVEVHRQDVIDYARENVHVRTLDNQLLLQRFFFDYIGLGDISREIKPPHKDLPIHSTIKCLHKRKVYRENREKKRLAEQLQEQISRLNIAKRIERIERIMNQ